MNLFILVATILFFLLFIIWQKSSWFNLLLKIIFFAMGAWGVFTLYSLRIVVR